MINDNGGECGEGYRRAFTEPLEPVMKSPGQRVFEKLRETTGAYHFSGWENFSESTRIAWDEAAKAGNDHPQAPPAPATPTTWEPWSDASPDLDAPPATNHGQPIQGPPCVGCRYWRPQWNYARTERGITFDGIQCCHTPNDMESDFSCFRPKEQKPE